MTTCDEARSELGRAQERVYREREVLQGYSDKMRDLEYDHSDLTRRWQEASALVVENERSWQQARDDLGRAKEAERAAEEKLEYWNEQQRRLRNGETTDYSGESNERALIDGQRDSASNVEYNAEQARKRAEDEVRQGEDRFERSKQFLQEQANKKFANEDAQSTLRNRISLQEQAVRDAENWAGQAQSTVDRVC